MKEEKIRAMLEVQNEKITINVPSPIAKRLLILGYKKYGTKAKSEVISKAALWALCSGIIEWEQQPPAKPHKNKPKTKIIGHKNGHKI